MPYVGLARIMNAPSTISANPPTLKKIEKATPEVIAV